jgi:hypothetical protein
MLRYGVKLWSVPATAVIILSVVFHNVFYNVLLSFFRLPSAVLFVCLQVIFDPKWGSSLNDERDATHSSAAPSSSTFAPSSNKFDAWKEPELLPASLPLKLSPGSSGCHQQFVRELQLPPTTRNASSSSRHPSLDILKNCPLIRVKCDFLFPRIPVAAVDYEAEQISDDVPGESDRSPDDDASSPLYAGEEVDDTPEHGEASQVADSAADSCDDGMVDEHRRTWFCPGKERVPTDVLVKDLKRVAGTYIKPISVQNSRLCWFVFFIYLNFQVNDIYKSLTSSTIYATIGVLLVVRLQLSSSNPNFSKLRTANSEFWS